MPWTPRKLLVVGANRKAVKERQSSMRTLPSSSLQWPSVVVMGYSICFQLPKPWRINNPTEVLHAPQTAAEHDACKNTSLEENCIKDGRGKVLTSALLWNRSLKTPNVSGNEPGADEAVVLVYALSVHRMLKLLVVQYRKLDMDTDIAAHIECRLDGKGVQDLVRAVKDEHHTLYQICWGRGCSSLLQCAF